MSRFSLSLNKLISALLNQPNKHEYVALPGEDIKPTTIRIEPAVRKFCDDQAEKMGISIQAFIAMVLNGVMLESTHPAKFQIVLIYERFFEIFKIHNIATADIPNILKNYNITLSTLADQNRLLDKLDEKLITHISQLFCANSDWLKGCSNSARADNLIWYKNIYSFCTHLIELKNRDLDPHLMFVKSDKTNLSTVDDSIEKQNEILLIIRLSSNYLPGKMYYYYQICESGNWSYWRARLHLKTIALFCNVMKISFGGYTFNLTDFKKVAYQENFVNEIVQQPLLTSYTWYPEDYINFYAGDYSAQKNKEEAQSVYIEFFDVGLDKLIKSYDHLGLRDEEIQKVCAFKNLNPTLSALVST